MARIFLERRDMGDDMASFPDAAAGECSPPIDVEERRGREIRLPIRIA